ncbi:MAG TPA: polysaccharide biosynthesis/export family protein [Geobacteraceae bacterium]|nr:polysaccharide biosynthesis/export family protein [Geobacteraceae bacterium]
MKQIAYRIQYRLLSFFMGLIFITGCAGYTSHPPGTVKSIELADVSPVVSSEQVTVAGDPLSASPPADYLVGPGDILAVAIYGLPNMSSDGRPDLPSTARGSRVDSAGTIQLPLVGSVQVAGLSLQQIRDSLQDSFRKYLKSPSVVVEMVEYKSHPLYLLGQFKKPGTHYMDRPINLLQGVSLGDGLDSTANLRGARLLRGNKIVPVDIYSLLHDGDQRQNVWLSPGDTVYVPDNTLQNVFVFGAVKTPGPILMKNGQLSLHQAVAAAGGLGDTSYDRNIRIIRSLTPTRGELIVVDLDRILAGEARPFPLTDGDIVYVPKSRIGDWNQAINELLPTFSLIGAILNPFVQMKFLSQ